MRKMFRIPRRFCIMASTAAHLLGCLLTISFASSMTIRALQLASDAKRKKLAISCTKCAGTGFYICKLCKGISTIEWSPLYDPVAINPCLCPTCDGKRIQRCLKCLGKGYI